MSAHDPNSLGRQLLYTVFTNNALSECNSSKYGRSAEKKMMLNQKGIKAILRFVERYTLKRKRTAWLGHPDADWTDEHTRRLKRSITKKCNEIKMEKRLNLKFKNVI